MRRKLSAIGLTATIITTLAAPAAVAVEEAQYSFHQSRFNSSYNPDTVDWAGQTWAIRGTDTSLNYVDAPQAPHPRTGKGEWVNGTHISRAGDLVLRNQGIQDGVEIINEQALGYGTDTFEYSADFDRHHPNTVLGIFTFDWADAVLPGHIPQPALSETDLIEISRWGEPPHTPVRAGGTVYTDITGEPTYLEHFDIPAGTQRLTTTTIWHPTSFQVITRDIPEPRTTQVHVNLWTAVARGGAETATGDTVTLQDFSFTPYLPPTNYLWKFFA